MRAHEEVDCGHALGVRERELLVGGREQAREADDRDQGAVPDRVADPYPVERRVALGVIDGQSLVEPAGRRVVRVVDRRMEDEVRQLVRDHGTRPTSRRSPPGGSARTAMRISASADPADVLAGAGPERPVEVALVAVDPEVDGVGLGDAEARLGVRDALRRDLERAPPERLVAVVPVDAHRRAARRLVVEGPPVEPVVEERERDLRAEGTGSVLGRDAELPDDISVRVDVVLARGRTPR